MKPFGNFAEDCRLIRRKSPIIHNITNYVAMSLSANALLAIGASPLMSSEPDEMEDIAAVSSALVINLGCLERRQIEAMRLAAAAAERLSKPWVLDPVGAGVSRLRTDTALEWMSRYHPKVVRGNASEIMALAGSAPHSHGVDSAEDSLRAADSADALARKYGTVVSVSGPTDYITNGEQCWKVANGSPLMPVVTAMGCTASAVTAAFLAVDADALSAASCAMALMGLAGETAAARSEGPGSLSMHFIDVLSRLRPEDAYSLIRYE